MGIQTRRKIDRPLTVKEAALRPALGLDQEFDLMVVGEIVEAKNQSLDWFNNLRYGERLRLYHEQLSKPPRRPKAEVVQIPKGRK